MHGYSLLTVNSRSTSVPGPLLSKSPDEALDSRMWLAQMADLSNSLRLLYANVTPVT